MPDSTERPAGDDPSGPRSVAAGALSRRRLLAALSATAVGGTAIPGCASAVPDGLGGASGVGDGPGSDDSVVQEAVWVETDVDSNDSGEPDRIYVDVLRPDVAEDDAGIPVIMMASPYNGEQTHSDATPEMLYDRAVELSADGDAAGDVGGDAAGDVGGDADTVGGSSSLDDRRALRSEQSRGVTDEDAVPHHSPRAIGAGEWPNDVEARYLQQGYALARASSLGTHRSTGCYTAAAPVTFDALASVVDWFNGRATAYDSRTGGTEVVADWATGKTGMVGTSAVGELANGVATTGVDGLEAIVPRAANAGHYSLFRANGTPISVVPDGDPGMTDLGTWVQAGTALRPACDHWVERVEAGQDRETGDYNEFWHEREFVPEADAVDAAVLITHAVDDPVVKPNQFAEWYEALDARAVPLKLWLHRGGHGAPRGEAFEALLQRWWDHWLMDADNGVMDEDPVTVEHVDPPAGGDGPATFETWPVPGTEPATVRFEPGGRSVGRLTVGDPHPDSDQGAVTETDTDPDTVTEPDTDTETDTVNGDGASQAAETFVDDPTTPLPDLAAAETSAHRLRYETPPLAEPVHVSGRVVPRLAVSFDEPTVVSAALVEYTATGPQVVTRGWADPHNRPRYGDYDATIAYKESLRTSAALDAGEQVTVEFPLQATEHVFDPGNRIGLVVYASDRNFTLHPPGNAEVTLSLAASPVAIPVVGGASALDGAFGATGTHDPDGGATGTATHSAAGEPGSDDGSGRGPTTGDRSGDDETTTSTGPGFGIGGALAALGGVGSRLRRRLDDEEAGSERE